MRNKIYEIESILNEVFKMSQYQFAAKKLLDAGFSSQDLWDFIKTRNGNCIPSHQTNNTMNEIRNFEITGNWSKGIYSKE